MLRRPILPIGITGRESGHNMPTNPTNHTDRESIATFVRRRRRESKLTQRQLAELVGTGVRIISEIENGKPTLRMDVVNRVLAAFGQQLGITAMNEEGRR